MTDLRCECGWIFREEGERCFDCSPLTDEERAANNREQAVKEFGLGLVEAWEEEDRRAGRVFNWVAWPNFGDDRDANPLQ